MANPITFDRILHLMNNPWPGIDAQDIKVILQNDNIGCCIYNGWFELVPDYLLSMYKENAVIDIRTPLNTDHEDNEAGIEITLKGENYYATFDEIFCNHKPEDSLLISIFDPLKYHGFKDLFFGKMSELPKLLYDEIEKLHVLIEAPYSEAFISNCPNSPEKYTIILAEEEALVLDPA